MDLYGSIGLARASWVSSGISDGPSSELSEDELKRKRVLSSTLKNEE